MAKLTSKARAKIPAKKFGVSSERKYPMPDKSHAANAKARASQQTKKGNLSPGVKAHIDEMADHILGTKRKR